MRIRASQRGRPQIPTEENTRELSRAPSAARPRAISRKDGVEGEKAPHALLAFSPPSPQPRSIHPPPRRAASAFPVPPFTPRPQIPPGSSPTHSIPAVRARSIGLPALGGARVRPAPGACRCDSERWCGPLPTRCFPRRGFGIPKATPCPRRGVGTTGDRAVSVARGRPPATVRKGSPSPFGWRGARLVGRPGTPQPSTCRRAAVKATGLWRRLQLHAHARCHHHPR